MTTFKLPAFRRRRWLLTGAVAVLISGENARAVDKWWDGGGTNHNWLTGANWDSDSAPGINDSLFFGGSTRLDPMNNFAAGTVFNGLTFDATAGAYTLSGAGLILATGIGAGGGTASGGNITNRSQNTQTIALPLTLSAGNHTIATATGSGALNLNGAFQRSPGGTTVFAVVGGGINFSSSGLANDATAGGGLLGGWATIGPDWAALGASRDVVAYNGYATAETAIASDASQNVRIQASSGTATLMSPGTTDLNTLLYNGNSGKQTLEVGAGNVLRLGAQGGIYNAAPANGTARQLVIGASAAAGGMLTAGGADNTPGEITFIDHNLTSTVANNLTINARIADNGSSSFPVRVNVLGYVVFTDVANTYSGGTFINGGRLRAGNVASFGSGPVTIAAGAQAFLVAGGMWSNHFFISGEGPAEADGGITGPGAIRLGNTANITGTVTLQGSARIATSSGASPQISGQITGSGPLELSGFAATNAELILANPSAPSPNNWTGNLAISSLSGGRAVSIRLGANEQIPDTANVTISGIDVAKLDLSGFSETFGALTSSPSPNNQISNSGSSPSILTLGANDGTGVFGGTIRDGGDSNAISLIKIGSGTQTLGGANTFSGSSVIRAGTLSITGSLSLNGVVNVQSSPSSAGTLSGAGDGVTTGVAGTVTLAASVGANLARIAPGATSAAGAIGTLTLAELTVNGGDLAMDLSTTSDLIHVTETALFAGPSTITPSSDAPAGIHTVLTADTLTMTVPPTVVSPTDTRKTFAPDFTTPNAIAVMVTGASKALTFTGLNGSAWDVNLTSNWNDGAIAETYFNGDTVNLLDGPTERTLTLGSVTVAPGAVNVNNSAADYSITGAGSIGGAAVLTKSGTAKLIIATNNTFTGGTTVGINSTLQVGRGDAMGTLGAGVVANEGTLDFNRSDIFAFSNVISGAGGVRQSGTGSLILTGANTYTGNTTVSSGLIQLTNNASLGSIPAGAVYIATGGTLDLAGILKPNDADFGQKQFHVAGDGFGGGGALVNSGPAIQQNAFQRVALTADTSFGGTTRFDVRAIQEGGVNVAALDLSGHTLVKSGLFLLGLAATDVTDGNIVVEQGTLSIELTTNIPDFGTGRRITFNAGTTLQLFATSLDPSSVVRPMTFNGPGIQIGNSSAQASLIGSPILLNGNITLTALSSVAGSLTVAGNITEAGGARSVTKAGPSAVTLSGNNAYTGGTTVFGGTLTVGSPMALGGVTGSLTVNAGGIVDLNGYGIAVGKLSGTSGTITNGALGLATLTTASAADGTFAGAIRNGVGELGLTKQGTGTLLLTGANAYSGPTIVTGGALIIGDGATGSLSGTASVTLTSGARLGGSGFITVPGGNVTLGDGAMLAPGSSAGTLTVDLGGGQFDIRGAAAGAGAFEFELGATSDTVALLASTLQIGIGALELSDFAFSNSGGFEAGTFTLFDGSTPIVGSLGGNVSGLVLGLPATLSMADGGNDLVLVVVPEPATPVLLLAGLGAFGARRSARQR